MTLPAETTAATPNESHEFWDWLQVGRDRGWVSEPVCDTHDGPPLTHDEAEQFEEGYDPCVHVLRLWPDGEPAPSTD